MILSPVQSGFRTIAAEPARVLRSGGGAVGSRLRAQPLERWGFEATVDDADEVFLVLEEDQRASRWTPMTHDAETGRWSAQLSLRPGRRKASLYAQRGQSLLQCGGGGLQVIRPANAGGEVRIELASLRWRA